MKSAPQKDASIARLELLESMLEEKGIGREARSARIPKRPSGQLAPLSFAQHRLWFLEQLTPGTAAYNIHAAVRLEGRLDVASLEHSLDVVVGRHESLRSSFEVSLDQPVQIVAEETAARLEITDLQGMSTLEQEREVQRLAEQEAQTPFDLAQGPLLRVKLLRLADEKHVFLLTLHHIISDEISLGILMEELGKAYSSHVLNQKPKLPALPIQYGDYSAWQREWLQGEVLEKQLAYWRERLEGAPAMLELSTDRPRSSAFTYRGAHHQFLFEDDLSVGLNRLAREENATLFMVLLAALQVLLSRYTGQEDIVVGTPIANRTRRETEPLIGLFVNTLALRSRVHGGESFRDLLDRVRQNSLRAFEHLELPFEKLVEELQPERDQSRTPIFQVMFVMQSGSSQAVQLPGLKLTPLLANANAAKFDLTWWAQEVDNGGLAGNLEYNADLFEEESIARMAAHYKHLIRSIVNDPDRDLAQLPLMSSVERRQILEEWNLTTVSLPKDLLAHEPFEKQAEATPEAFALAMEDRSVSYAELNRQANQLANYLRKRGIGPDRLVGICVERSVEMIVAVLGVLKAGGAYVPLDPGYPAERLRYMIEDSGIGLLLTSEGLRSLFPELPVEAIDLDRDWVVIAKEPGDNLRRTGQAANLAYVIYTSGSTGKPKGVMITHEGLLNYLIWCKQRYALDQGIGAPVISSISFDLTVTSIYAPLFAGRTVVLAPADLSIENLSKALHAYKDFSLLKLTPSHLDILAYSLKPQDLAECARALIIGGESLGYEALAVWRLNAPGTRLINEYGPTETVVGCCVYEVQVEDPFFGSVPIGRPIQNTTLYILDSHMEPVPPGVVGGIYIGGAGVARGYLFRPELTGERFVPDQFSEQGGQRLYKTGDLGRYRADGVVEYLGRADYQVKIRGYRVELGEIEAALAGHEAITEAVVVAREDEPDQKRLIGYVVMKEDLQERPGATQLRVYLRERLPEYMVPTVILELERLPLTPNGKVDRKALPKPERLRSDGDLPRDEVELKLTILWEDLLRVSGVGRRDSFFAIGGHSFMAITLMSRIRDQFGYEVPLAAFFENATIENLANLIRKACPPGPVSHLVPIQPKGQGRPIFLVHAISGGALCYVALSRHLVEQPLYAFQAISAEDIQGEKCMSIEERAVRYVQAMKTLQPQGPYLLGGWSFGGFVAYEMAQQLALQGEQVSLLVLLDIQPRTAADDVDEADDPKTDAELLITIARDSMQQGGPPFDVKFEEIQHLDLNQQIQRVLDSMVRFDLLPPEVRVEETLEFLQGHRRRGESLREYELKPYPGKITLIRGLDPSIGSEIEKPADSPEDLTAGWSNFSPQPVAVYSIPGDHQNLIYPPYVGKLAEVLKLCIAEAENGV